MILRVAGPDRLGALDVYALLEAHHLSPDHPGGRRPFEDADHNDHVEQARAPQVGDDHGEYEIGDDKQVIGHPHQGNVHPAAEITGQDADSATDDHRDQSCRKADHERDAAALHQFAEHVDAAVVAAKP